MGDDIVITATSRGLIHIWRNHDLKFPVEKSKNDPQSKASKLSSEDHYTFETAREAQISFGNPHVDDDDYVKGLFSKKKSRKKKNVGKKTFWD